MDDEYLREHALRIRALAEKADPFIKKRLLALAERYDATLGRPSRATRALGSLAVPPQATPNTRDR